MSICRARASPEKLGLDFAALLAAHGPPKLETLLGVEHEFAVVSGAHPAAASDFRAIVHSLALGRPGLDPDDPYAYRLPSGNAVTCDEAEAEIALAPVTAGPGAPTALASASGRERDALAALLGPERSLAGHSTHVSVSVPTELGDPVGRIFAQAYGADLMRLVDSPERCGVWVRPRPGRLELCLDHVAGGRLIGVATFAAAAAAACLVALSGNAREALPPMVRALPRRPRQRSGWHLPRSAFRGDPFGEAGDTPLELVRGDRMAAGDHIALAWAGLGPIARSLASAQEVALTDALVEHPRDVPQALVTEDAETAVANLSGASRVAGAAGLPAAFGDALVARVRDGFEVAVVALTWSFAVFLILRLGRAWRRDRRAFACVPRDRLATFLSRLDGGALDGVLRSYLGTRPQPRVLERPAQTAAAGLFDEIGLRRDLLPAEPVLARPRLRVAEAGA